MTLVLSYRNGNRFLIAADQRITRIGDMQILDPAANKLVIYRGPTGTIALGYTGLARIGLTPTDEFIARNLYQIGGGNLATWDAASMSFGSLPVCNPPRVPHLIFNLVDRLKKVLPVGRLPFGLTIVGYSWSQKTLRPTFFQSAWSNFHGFQGGERKSLRQREGIAWVGDADWEVAWPKFDAHRSNGRTVLDTLVEMIRIRARTVSTVGQTITTVEFHPDVGMVVRSHLGADWRQPRSSMGMLLEQIADEGGVYSPWIIAGTGYCPPALMTMRSEFISPFGSVIFEPSTTGPASGGFFSTVKRIRLP